MMRASAGAAAVVLGLGALAWAAGAQEQPAFPASLERATLLAWMQRETDIMPERVVAVTPQSVTSVVSTFPAGGGQGPRVVIRAEALSAETFARTGSLSWHVSLSADCQARRVRLGETTGYAQRNLLGERRLLREADADWRIPEAGTALEYALRAACDPNFQGPFQTKTVKVAAAEGAPSTTAAPPSPSPAPAPAPRAVPAAVPVARFAPAAGGIVAQVGAAPSVADAQNLLTTLGRRVEGRTTWVETAQVGGKTWRRALVGGFASAADAQAFCAELKSAGRACFVRAGKPG
ncbi:MAG: SPOR domain-containing protein [Phenylobacterium sp.]|uniref:SPOR domain-containing protein n=1 Tax=Phenylobacterium sp. TaxID=1871053 RepID=UPI001A3E840D|nr:SPOR domain-containing protein [Phenylobacterium sp.]MBL8771956.1 SPOR domain-containing protein [Phenylobacterium sp.]